MFLSVSYDKKYQKEARKHMATSRDTEHSRAGSSAHTHLQQQCSHYTQHSNFQQHTRSGTSTKTKSCHNKELSKHIHSVLLEVNATFQNWIYFEWISIHCHPYDSLDKRYGRNLLYSSNSFFTMKLTQ